MSLIIVIVFIAAWAFVHVRREALGLPGLTVRGAYVLAFVLVQLALWAITELTSIGHHLTPGSVAALWTLVLVALLVGIPAGRRLAWRARIRAASREARGRIASLDAEELAVGAAVLVIFCVLAATGWLYPPSNSDSMVYHLPRVEQWVQNRSVAHFPTHYLAQIELAPLHEFNLAHLHLLAGTDRLDGYVQLLAASVCVAGASDLAHSLGASRRSQFYAALFCATVPNLMLEATSTQNNVFAAAIGVALFVVLLVPQPEHAWLRRAIWLGAIAGLAVIAKGTLPLLIAPAAAMLLLLGAHAEWRYAGPIPDTRRLLGTCVLALVVAGAVAGPLLARNTALFDAPMGPVSRSTIGTNLNLRAAAGNVIRSVAANFRIGDGEHGVATAVSRGVLGTLGQAYAALDLDPGDQRYLVGHESDAFGRRDYSGRAHNEDFGANPWHTILVGVTLVVLTAGAGRRKPGYFRPFALALALAAGFVAFTAMTRWSVYAVRYAVPVFVLWCPLIVATLARRGPWLLRVVAVVLAAAAVSPLADNRTRSLIDPAFPFESSLAPYFLSIGPARQEEYEAVSAVMARSSCRQLGLANWILVEYPLWAGLRLEGWRGTIQAVGVTNQSARLESAGFRPCAWIREEPPGHVATVNSAVNLQYGRLALAIRPEAVDASQVRIHGFASEVPGTHLLPGGGWALMPSPGEVVLDRLGTLYIFSDRPVRASLQLEPSPGAAPTTLRATLGSYTARLSAGNSEPFQLELEVPAGVTLIGLAGEREGLTETLALKQVTLRTPAPGPPSRQP